LIFTLEMDTKDIESNRQLDMALSNFKATMAGAYLGVCAASVAALIAGAGIMLLASPAGVFKLWAWQLIWLASGWIGACAFFQLLRARRWAIGKWIAEFVLGMVVVGVVSVFLGPHIGLGSAIFIVLGMMCYERLTKPSSRSLERPEERSAVFMPDKAQKALIIRVAVLSLGIAIGIAIDSGLSAYQLSHTEVIPGPVIPEPDP
jgi:hypothetical protein